MTYTDDMKKLKVIITIFIVFLAYLAAVGHNTMPPTSPTTEAADVPAPFILDPQVVSLANRAGISLDDLRLAHATFGYPPGHGVVANELSGYVPDTKTIYVYPSLLKQPLDKQVSAIAHEYLHWVWDTNPRDKTQWCNSLMSYYNDQGQLGYALHQRMQPYLELGVGSPVFCNELHSILGTEVADNELPPQTVDYYKRYLPNRGALPSYY